jgi:hypothetical protein
MGSSAPTRAFSIRYLDNIKKKQHPFWLVPSQSKKKMKKINL